MTDIVERLRQYSKRNIYAEDLCIKAADEIEQARAKLADPLVAAAPELLAALRTIDILMDNIRTSQGWIEASLCCGPRVHEAQDLARVAIAKAEGGAA